VENHPSLYQFVLLGGKRALKQFAIGYLKNMLMVGMA
jgi:hypothetical protein